ncbi:maleylpyruvate isomerase family mycothiol-dependent enzyme [Streptomyces sp. H10-C2]|uniref:maleylpyruvate isomerase family mycothiol-dependent enzyme n=1 Tax=unclassified Streptomyces TaxID=2593676 RepID=UPI0024BB0EA8|nr:MULTISPECIES: maleylpyruvate isomerase family mycothiol-dependent enzyme [unclassified Streptomyces]MDJ0343409.1 maleylpyruvate isomerase family mycothiol-dependent enzyme [Streptomyces sp. PH10-H1]MDJ0371780.1 maleylpyruvate isomerase family mycothiol-dependent enzyme [Streptomyces sp. H10-C2]
MDYVPHFHREILSFDAAVRRAAGADEAPLVPSCPNWSVTDLIGHLGVVHRYVARIIRERLVERPDITDLTFIDLPAEHKGWPTPENTPPNRGPVPDGLVDWFADGASALESLFESGGPSEPVWTWSQEHTIGFWLRMQTIEAAVHRWDAENATGAAQPAEAELAADAVSQTFEVMAPARRAWNQAPPGSGERFGFRQTDGTGKWTVRFAGDGVQLTEAGGPCDVEAAGTASDLMLFLWQRLPADRLDEVKGDRRMLDHYFTLVPPV